MTASRPVPTPDLDDGGEGPAAGRGVQLVFRAAIALTAGTVVLGSVVCATQASAACPTWPGCYPGRIVPRAETLPIIEGVHRLVAILTGPAILLACVLGLRIRSRDPRWRVLPWVALAGAAASAALGMVTVLWGLPRWLAVFDLGCALAALVCLTVAADAVIDPRPAVTRDVLPWAAWGAAVVMHLTGVLVAGAGSYTRCLGWPLEPTNDADLALPLQVVRFMLAVLTAALVALVAFQGREVPGPGPSTRTMGRAALLLLVLELVLGVVLRSTDGARWVHAGYSATAGVILWALGVAAARARTTR